ncbi:uncharacterized protein LOC126893194 isoform X3 [Diabrotica virgifera virgifera]|uniref:Autophagy-related protein 9 n=1 Tax=Diabrotica virgifera virgifera TaxID=50390 RepID=A0ABM5L9J6_DIAVI|nr:uncharacterized protein LOC126893194 isoform X2 [Diabrotica virgifera virgifera]XP_050519108.1 uncharacterized protein LOC126893194 isoform X3 [Diabrotica virgifera virgifera]
MEFNQSSDVTRHQGIKLYGQELEEYNKALANSRKGRGIMDDAHDYDHDNHHDIIVDHPPEMPKMKEEPKQAADAFTSYYDFIITEGSFKFWSAFQLFTALLLIYSSLAAAYYAKFNIITTDYDYYDDFFGRSNNDAPSTSLWSGLSTSTVQRILNAISSKKFT